MSLKYDIVSIPPFELFYGSVRDTRHGSLNHTNVTSNICTTFAKGLFVTQFQKSYKSFQNIASFY